MFGVDGIQLFLAGRQVKKKIVDYLVESANLAVGGREGRLEEEAKERIYGPCEQCQRKIDGSRVGTDLDRFLRQYHH
jgi:hypothetical protein